MICRHDLAEQDTATADGLCPLCLRHRVARLKRALEKLCRRAEGWADADDIDEARAELAQEEA